jgi:hypothetical protein
VDSRLSHAQFLALLEDVSTRLEDPPATYLATRVRARIETAPRAAPGSRWVRYAVAGVAAALLVSMLIALSPSTRRAVADWFGLRGVEIERDATPPTVLGGELDLGRAVTLTEAEHSVAFDVLVPRGLGAPDEVYVADSPTGGRVDLLYQPDQDLPPAAASGVGMLLTEFRADSEVISKRVGDDVRVESVTVDGNEGVWLEGGTHVVELTDESGEQLVDNTRLAGNTLIWQRGALTVRLESGLAKEDAIRIARSLVGA